MRTQDYYDNKRNNYDTSHNIGDVFKFVYSETSLKS